MTADPAPGAAVGSSGANTGYAIVGTLISGIVVWGGLGWLLDLWFGIRLFSVIGVVVGMVLGIYLVMVKFAELPTHRPRPTDDRPTPGKEGRRR